MNKFTCKVYNFLKHEQFLFLLRNPVRPHWLCIIPTTIVLTDAWCILIASHNRGATFCSHTIHTRTKPQIVCLVCKLLPATKNCNWQRQLVHFAISNDDDQLLLEDLKWIFCATCTVLFFVLLCSSRHLSLLRQTHLRPIPLPSHKRKWKKNAIPNLFNLFRKTEKLQYKKQNKTEKGNIFLSMYLE